MTCEIDTHVNLVSTFAFCCIYWRQENESPIYIYLFIYILNYSIAWLFKLLTQVILKTYLQYLNVCTSNQTQTINKILHVPVDVWKFDVAPKCS